MLSADFDTIPRTIWPVTIQDSAQVQLEGGATAYDSVWVGEVPTATPSSFEAIMLAEDKLYVVLAVVLIIWFGLLIVMFRTDRKIAALEERMQDVTQDIDE
jgi:hypothetical protein